MKIINSIIEFSTSPSYGDDWEQFLDDITIDQCFSILDQRIK